MKAALNLNEFKNIKSELIEKLAGIEQKNLNDICWLDIINSQNPQQELRKWKANNEKKELKKRKIEEELNYYTQQFREKKLVEINNIKFKYYCSICLIIRDESEYLEEWLNWHIKQGAQHFYIYDHGSKKSVAQFLKKLALNIQSKITLTDFSGKHECAQHEAYNDCLTRFGSESRWIGFIDSDEMVRVKIKKSLPEFLQDYEEHAGLMAVWIVYGASGQEKKLNLPCRERFKEVSPSDIQAGLGKVFVQSLLMKKMVIHNGYPIEGFEVVDEYKNHLKDASTQTEFKSTELICIDHYFTKSYEEWIEKMKRGSCDSFYNRNYLEFFVYNPDMKNCMESLFPIQQYEISQK